MINNLKVLAGAFIFATSIVSNSSASSNAAKGFDLCEEFNLFDPEPVGELSHLSPEELKAIEKQKQAEQRQVERQMPNTGIPKDVLVLVLKWLEPSDYEKAGQVCKEFYRITRDRANLPAHLNSQINTISAMGVCTPLLRHLAQIKADANRMREFEANNMHNVTDIYRMISFYEKVVGQKATCPGDLVKLDRDRRVAIELPDGNKYLSQVILKNALVVLRSLERIVSEDVANPLNAKLRKDIAKIKLPLESTQSPASNG